MCLITPSHRNCLRQYCSACLLLCHWPCFWCHQHTSYKLRAACISSVTSAAATKHFSVSALQVSKLLVIPARALHRKL